MVGRRGPFPVNASGQSLADKKGPCFQVSGRLVELERLQITGYRPRNRNKGADKNDQERGEYLPDETFVRHELQSHSAG